MLEEMTADPNFTEELFKLVHELDPKPKLFVNDYNIVKTGVYTSVSNIPHCLS
jgi:endo-1,4-beta-xylanase